MIDLFKNVPEDFQTFNELGKVKGSDEVPDWQDVQWLDMTDGK